MLEKTISIWHPCHHVTVRRCLRPKKKKKKIRALIHFLSLLVKDKPKLQEATWEGREENMLFSLHSKLTRKPFDEL